MTAWGQVTDLVLLTLGEIGQATARALAEAAGVDAEPVRKTLNRMSKGPMAKRRVHIATWDRHAEGQRAYPRPVYALGPGPNAKRPPAKSHTDSTREMCQRAQRVISTTVGYLPQKQARKELAALRAKGLVL